ncbi:hypothetical protein BDZ94DRAFT_1305830 [Collybia nuda]|uniref:Uncharacterized protein n=1 Tax=Collybia nuda TaxID=64659 RepID=A0A9P5YBA8_9AGAR|nr:hypothetical protein BDZ94DRAFT_1305830 [Collybia nuda]
MASNKSAGCGAEFSWADNSRDVSPCDLVGNLFSVFASDGGWKAPPLDPGFHYTPPEDGETMFGQCACSWVAYNLIHQTILSCFSWSGYSANCGSTTEICLPPQSLPDSEDLAVPAWASTNPKSWYFQQFNVAQAREIADQGSPDLLPSGHGRDSPTAAIVGIIGGLALVVLIGIGLYLTALLRQNGPTSPGEGLRRRN